MIADITQHVYDEIQAAIDEIGAIPETAYKVICPHCARKPRYKLVDGKYVKSPCLCDNPRPTKQQGVRGEARIF